MNLATSVTNRGYEGIEKLQSNRLRLKSTPMICELEVQALESRVYQT